MSLISLDVLDAMSNERVTSRAEIVLNDKLFEGCGLLEPDIRNGIATVETFDVRRFSKDSRFATENICLLLTLSKCPEDMLHVPALNNGVRFLKTRLSTPSPTCVSTILHVSFHPG